MECPNCKLINPETAQRCDCGYDFTTKTRPSYSPGARRGSESARSRGPLSWYLEAWRKYAVFAGRARRKEYWYFYLFHFIATVLLGILEGVLGIAPDAEVSVLANIYILIGLVPTISVGIRRLHDTAHSGWWLLVPIVNLIFLVTNGQQGENRFGPDPKAASGTRRDKPAANRGASEVVPLRWTVWRLG